MTNFVQTFRSINSVDGSGNNCYGIDQKHPAHSWVKKKILQPIGDKFEPNIKLIFAMLLDCVQPFDIHKDLKEMPEPDGKHFLSFLIPYSVDNDPALCHNASTIIFNESHDVSTTCSTIENNVSYMHKDKISHTTYDRTLSVSFKEELLWSPGDLHWWDSKLLHVSNNFLINGYTSKQAIVLHTYTL